MSLLDQHGNAIIRCTSPDCTNRATVFPELQIPPKGHGFGQCLKLRIALPLCVKHGKAEKPETFLTDNLRRMASATVDKSPVPLDFDRARISLKAIGGDEWQAASHAASIARAGRQRALNS
jgi:hypothetical protein